MTQKPSKKRSALVLISFCFQYMPAEILDLANLSNGPIPGQAGWTAYGKYSVVDDPTGGGTVFSGNVLGDTPEATLDWVTAERPLGTIVEYSMDFWMADGSSEAEKPTGLFVRFTGWDSFVAIKPTEGWLE